MFKLNMDNIDLVICGSYGPSHGDHPQYFDNLFNQAFMLGTENIIITGDHNCTLNHAMDNRGYRNNQNNPNASAMMNTLVGNFQMSDIFRKLHPNTLAYTWENPDNDVTQKSRIDYFLTSTSVTNNTLSANVYPITNFSDHSLIDLTIDMNQVTMAPGYWKVRDYILPHNQLGINMKNMVYNSYGQYRTSDNQHSYLDNLSNEEKELFFSTDMDIIGKVPLIISAIDFLDILVNRSIKVCQEYSASLRTVEVNQLDLIQSETQFLNKENLTLEIDIVKF